MVIKGFISFQNAWVKSSEDKCITFPLLTSDLVAGVTCPGLETTSGIAQTWTKSFLKKDYQSNSFNMAVESIQLQSLRHPAIESY